MGGLSIVKQGAHLSKPPGKSNATKAQKCELMQELPKGCNNVFIMGDLQRGTLQSPQKAFREVSLQGTGAAQNRIKDHSLVLEQHNSSAAPQAQESRPELLIDRFTCKYLWQRGRGATRLGFSSDVENTTLH